MLSAPHWPLLTLLVLAPAVSNSQAPDTACSPAALRARDARQCVTTDTLMLNGVVVPPGSTLKVGSREFLHTVHAAAETRIGSLVLPAGARIFFRDNWQPYGFHLAHDTTIAGFLIRGMNDGARNLFYQSGALRAIWLVEDTVVDGIPCTTNGNPFQMGFGVIRMGTRRMLWLYENGRLEQALVARDTVRDGEQLRKGSIVVLDRDGHVSRVAPRGG